MSVGNISNNNYGTYQYENNKSNNKFSFSEEKEKFGAFVKDRIKNGDPKIMIGGAEMSNKEWDKLIEKVDKNLDQVKEEMAERLEKRRPVDGEVIEKQEAVRGQYLTDMVNQKSKVPYANLAEDGIVSYNGTIFVYDEEHSALCLGDMSDEKNVITIPMSNGGNLKVNRDNLGDLANAIGMFSPEDVKRIMEAIAQDKKVQQTLKEIDDDKNSIGDGNTNTANGEETNSQVETEADAVNADNPVFGKENVFEITEAMLIRLVEEQREEK